MFKRDISLDMPGIYLIVAITLRNSTWLHAWSNCGTMSQSISAFANKNSNEEAGLANYILIWFFAAISFCKLLNSK